MNNQSENLAARVSLRPVTMPEDEDFLIKVYFSTRDDVASMQASQEQKDAFMMQQYRAQKEHYDAHFTGATHDIILLDEQPVGRFMVARQPEEVIVVDLSLLPERRNQGIGTILLRDLIDEAVRTNRVVNLHVKQNNRAVRLYRRLGFSVTGETGFHFKMKLEPQAGEPEQEQQQ